MFGYKSVEAQLALCAHLDMDIEKYLEDIIFSDCIGLDFINDYLYVVLSAKIIQLGYNNKNNVGEKISVDSKEALGNILENIEVTLSDDELIKYLKGNLEKQNPTVLAVQTIKDNAKYIITGFNSDDLERIISTETIGGLDIFG